MEQDQEQDQEQDHHSLATPSLNSMAVTRPTDRTDGCDAQRASRTCGNLYPGVPMGAS